MGLQISMKKWKVLTINIYLDIFTKKHTTNEANKAEDLRKRKKLILEVA